MYVFWSRQLQVRGKMPHEQMKEVFEVKHGQRWRAKGKFQAERELTDCKIKELLLEKRLYMKDWQSDWGLWAWGLKVGQRGEPKKRFALTFYKQQIGKTLMAADSYSKDTHKSSLPEYPFIHARDEQGIPWISPVCMNFGQTKTSSRYEVLQTSGSALFSSMSFQWCSLIKSSTPNSCN